MKSEAKSQTGPAVSASREDSATTRTELADERTILAAERTLLAQYRTSFGAYALAIGFANFIPSLSSTSSGAKVAYITLGVCFALIGAAFFADSILRYRRLQGQFSNRFETREIGNRSAFRVIAAGVLIATLGVATAVVIVVDRLS